MLPSPAYSETKPTKPSVGDVPKPLFSAACVRVIVAVASFTSSISFAVHLLSRFRDTVSSSSKDGSLHMSGGTRALRVRGGVGGTRWCTGSQAKAIIVAETTPSATIGLVSNRAKLWPPSPGYLGVITKHTEIGSIESAIF